MQRTSATRLIGIGLAVLLTTGVALAADGDDEYAVGRKHHLDRRFEAALVSYRQAASKGHAAAMNQIGALHWAGDGVKQDYAEAAIWFRKAADKGNVDAMSDLGTLYLNGQGVKQDDAEAIRWFRLAAEKGDALAMFNLGVLYGTGQSVKQDDAVALSWLRKAAETGDARAMYFVGSFYEDGQGTKQDSGEALRWYRKAALAGHKQAQAAVDRLEQAEGRPSQTGAVAKGTVPELTALLKTGDAARRLDVVRGLLAIGTPESVQVLGAVLLYDPDGDVQSEAARALGTLGKTSDVAVAMLTAVLDRRRGEPSPPELRALQSLGARAAPATRAILRHFWNEFGHMNGPFFSKVLGAIGPGAREALPALVAGALQQKDAAFAEVSRGAIERIALGSPVEFSWLESALKSGDAFRRLQAAFGLGRLGRRIPEVVAVLRTALNTGDKSWIVPTIKALRLIGPKAAAAGPDLVKWLASEDSELRQTSAWALVSMDHARDRVRVTLTRDLLSTNVYVRLAAAFIFAEMGKAGQPYLPILEAARKKEKDQRVQDALDDAIWEIDTAK